MCGISIESRTKPSNPRATSSATSRGPHSRGSACALMYSMRSSLARNAPEQVSELRRERWVDPGELSGQFVALRPGLLVGRAAAIVLLGCLHFRTFATA